MLLLLCLSGGVLFQALCSTENLFPYFLTPSTTPREPVAAAKGCVSTGGRGGLSENGGKGWGQAWALLRLRAEGGGVAQAPGRKREAAGAGPLASPFRLVPMEALGKLKQFDAYPKTLEDFRVKTCGGATGRAWRGRGRGEWGVLEVGRGAWNLSGLPGAEGSFCPSGQRPF